MLYLSQSSPSDVPCMFEYHPATWSLFHFHIPISPQQPAKYMNNMVPQKPAKYVNILGLQKIPINQGRNPHIHKILILLSL